ncbi:gamma-aminobutyric acid receptor subunit rho-3 [Pseudoliparis swirei]|uniref:gamma-aminobutyric acid receptor subunit rho-3 n=1 Tax=Pseudoliparis swirei TaxID=2059687 RepID=UPI0024BDFD4B|nr:gamma-aminobutyric acid receptor subunit rho-3 [Pseudoliparis swirei]
MKVDLLTCLALAATGLVAVATSGRSSGRWRHQEVFLLGENRKFMFGGRIDYKLKRQDSTKTLLIKSEQLLRIEEHDFAMRPGFGGAAFPVGIDVQVESIDSISEVNMDFTMTLYLRHYWKDERLAFPSRTNQSRTFFSSKWRSRREEGGGLPRLDTHRSATTPTHTGSQQNLSVLIIMGYRPAGITMVLTMSTIITGVSSSMPQVSYVKAVDVYLWTSFMFVFLSVIEYAAVNYCTTLEEMRKMKRGKIPSTFNASQAMAFDGCFHDNDVELTPFAGSSPPFLTSDPLDAPDARPREGTRLRRQRSVRENVDLFVSNSYVIDSYSRLAFPLSYLLFNTIYWSLYA